jgi:hypothetical protein
VLHRGCRGLETVVHETPQLADEIGVRKRVWKLSRRHDRFVTDTSFGTTRVTIAGLLDRELSSPRR